MHPEERLRYVIEDKNSKVQMFLGWYAFFWTVNLAGLSLIQQLSFPRQAIMMFMVLAAGAFMTSCFLLRFVIARNKDIARIDAPGPHDVPIVRPRIEYAWGAIVLLSFPVLLGVWILVALHYWSPA
jgi:hypothetical protein